ncbi:MAG: hypothetical protein C4539_09960 [Ignavibacteriales bacterium]|nr:MAG: hypothetical protein C4539_09960 [Ignavibacteriales bacterium]
MILPFKGKYFFVLLFLFVQNVPAQFDYRSPALPLDTLCSHKVVKDGEGKILSWYKPEIQGAGYVKVAELASEFIKNCPVEPTTKLKLYMVHADFDGPNQNKNFNEGTSGTEWMPNPACTFAGFVQSFAVDFRTYSGDTSYISIIRECLNQMLSNGTTPKEWIWAQCPYASADPKSRIYNGATNWENEGRGDGFNYIEPDKVGELGAAYLAFFEITGEVKYFNAAVNCADALAKHVRNVSATDERFATNFSISSPWPFRVNAKTGHIKDDYCSNVVAPVKLFDELIRLYVSLEKNSDECYRLFPDPKKIDLYKKAAESAWNWLFSKNGPMKTFVWNGYFEDVPVDTNRINRVQITPLETARYILSHPEKDSNWRKDVPAILHWVASAFGVEGMDAIREQTWCYEPMGSHTARYASVCALWYEKTGEEVFKDEAFHFFNFATYMCEKNGYVWTGPDWPTSWFTDGYGDYVQHFMEGLTAIPEWAPQEENHLLGSTSVVKEINYSQSEISYSTFYNSSVEVLRLVCKPVVIKVNNKPMRELADLNQDGFTWEDLQSGGILRIKHSAGAQIKIIF